MAKTGTDKKTLAERYFFDTDFTQEEIAELLDVTPQTISRWATDGNWKAKKASYTITPRDIKNMLYEQIFAIREKAQNANRPLDNKEADAISKLATAVERVDKRMTNSTFFAVFMEFNNWLRGVDLESLKKLAIYEREFMSERKDG